MANRTDAVPDRPVAGPRHESDAPELHVVSGRDVAVERRRDTRFQQLLARGDRRDQAAELRDRAAEARAPASLDPQGWLDRDWAGRDRDAAAGDRADLLALLDEPGGAREQPTP